MDNKQLINSKTLSIDKVVRLLGGFGPFQLLTIVMCALMAPARAAQILFMVFGGLNPPWRCVENSTICTLNGTLSRIDRRRCSMPRTEWEYTVPRDFSIATEFDLQCEREWMRHFMNSIIFIGWAIGAVALGYAGDNYGRKLVMYTSQTVIIVVGFIMSFLQSMPLLIFCRFIIGFFVPGGTVQAFILISELVTSEYRSLATMLFFLGFSLGSSTFALQAYCLQKWRILSMVCTAPWIITVVSYFFVPKSIRFLRLKGKDEQIKTILQRIAYWNRKELPADLVIEPPSEITMDQTYSILDAFRTRRLAVMAVCVGFGWLANGMVFYGLVFASNDFGGSVYRNFIALSLIGIPACAATIWLSNRIGRKKTVIILMLLSAILCVAIAFIPREKEGGKLAIRLTCAVMGRFFIGICFSTIYIWSTELYPTTIRANAMGFFQITSRIGSASAPWVATGLLSVHVAAPYLVMGGVGSIASILLLYIPETKGRVMLETNEEINNENTDDNRTLELLDANDSEE